MPKTIVLDIKESDKAWLAGIFDCRGSLSFRRCFSGYLLELEVRDRPNNVLLRSLREATGTGGLFGTIPRWRVCGREAIALLGMILPFMRVRAEQVRMAITTARTKDRDKRYGLIALYFSMYGREAVSCERKRMRGSAPAL